MRSVSGTPRMPQLPPVQERRCQAADAPDARGVAAIFWSAFDHGHRRQRAPRDRCCRSCPRCATLVSYQVIRKGRRRCKKQRRSAAWSLMHEQLRAPTDEDEDPYEYMDDWAFRRYHRLSREAFDHLLELISSDLEPVSRRWARGHLASPIAACTQLSVALRILVGGSYLDVSHSHRVSRPTCFTIVDRVVDAINSCEELDLPLAGTTSATTACSFSSTSVRHNSSGRTWCFASSLLMARQRWLMM